MMMHMKNKKEQSVSGIFPILLNKYLSHAGVCSRRQAVEQIKAGQIKVNDVVVREPWYNVHKGDRVLYKEKVVSPGKRIYILLNKPIDCVTTLSDQQGRRTVMNLVEDAVKDRVYPVGRLDRMTTGLLLITNDGQLTQDLAHPRNEVKKLYSIVLDRPLSHEDYQIIRGGIRLKDGVTNVDSIYYVPGKRKNHVKVQLHSGKNRIVRRIFEHFGYNVLKLDRVNYAGLAKSGLPVGRWRFLTQQEVRDLKTAGVVHRRKNQRKKK